MIKKAYLTTFTVATLSAISLCYGMNNNKNELTKAMNDLEKQTQKTIDSIDRCINAAEKCTATVDKCNATVEHTTRNITELSKARNKQSHQSPK